MEIVLKRLSDISPYENNPRKNDEAVKYVAESIREFGFKVPIVIDRNNIIVAGHTRYKAAKKLNIKEVPCIVADDLTDEQVKAFRLADNKVAEKAEWDFELLSDELDGLFDFDMTVFGFDEEEEEEKPEVHEDEYEIEPPEEPKAKLGDIYKLGNHRLMCGDSTSIEDVERLMAGEKASMGFTDPPWNVNYGAVKDGNAQGYKPRTILNDFMGTEDFKEFMNKAFASLNFAMADGAMTYVVMSAQEWGNMMLTLAQNNYHWSSTIIWNKDSLVLSRKDYHTKYEPIWYGWKEGTRLCPLEDRKQSDVWDIPRPKKSEEHPTMKPVELVARAITNSSKKGDVVIDLFGGSGTTLIASEQTDRCCRMMELDPKYVDVIVNRWEQLTGMKAELINADNQS
jgi:site-specific DNA-methyltransferase (adenine-specific)